MKKVFVFLMFLVLFSSTLFVNAQSTNQDVIIDSQIKDVYNLGDRIPMSLKVSSTTYISDELALDLICEGHEKNLMSINGYTVDSAEKKEIGYELSLNQMNDLVGSCKLRASFGDDITIKEFELSDKLEVNIKDVSENVKPGENLVVKGDVLKQSGSSTEVNGFYNFDLKIGDESEGEKEEGSVENGFFKINKTIPEKLAAGEYTGGVDVYQKDSEGKTNTGEAEFKFSVAQIPTNLEIIFEEDEIKPEGEAEIKTILHDQTGKNIPKNVTITITDPSGMMVKRENTQTGKTLKFEIESDETLGKWNVSAVSESRTTEAEFEVLENKETEVTLMNNTVFIENIGNVHYNDSVEVKIGNQTEKVEISLAIGETKKYYLSAPEGNYTVEVLADGEKRIQQNVQLTGKSISIKETLNGNLISNPIVWGFVIIVLGVVLYIVFRKGYKRSFIGRKIHPKKSKKKNKQPTHEDSEESEKKNKDKATEAMNQGILPLYNNKAELSLSIKGNKQDASVICLRINNYDSIKQNTEGAKETLNKIVETAEKNKAHIYETHENIFFIFAPEITKTFKNEKTAIQTALKIESELRNHNKYFKQRFDFGISVNRGEIISKKEKGVLKFMSVGKLTTSVKKLASISRGETLLTKDINEKLTREFKTERGEDKENKTEFYRVKEMKDRSQNQKFLNDFVKRYKEDEGKQK